MKCTPYPELLSYLQQYLVARSFQSWICRTLTRSSNSTSHLKTYVTINTHHGLYHYTCLLFGVVSVPAILRHTMETVLKGLPIIVVYIDDILVAGQTEQENLTSTGTSRLCWNEA